MEQDPEREARIANEAVVDAYGSEELALSWYYYLQNRITFPFKARCLTARKSSPLKAGELVEVLEMADEADCMSQMLVIVRFAGRTMGVPLVQLEPLAADATMLMAIGDWQYWVARGYTF